MADEYNLKNVNSPAVVAMTSPLHYLTDQQRIFCDNVVRGKPPIVSARLAGYVKPESHATELLKGPKIEAAIRYLYASHQKAAQMTRKKVMDGLVEAVEMAKLQADPANMIAGWREIGRMCGYYAPEVKRLEITHSAKRVIDKLEALTDEDLLKLVEDSSQVIEVEAREVLGVLQENQDARTPV